jgi:hypothetical protein
MICEYFDKTKGCTYKDTEGITPLCEDGNLLDCTFQNERMTDLRGELSDLHGSFNTRDVVRRSEILGVLYTIEHRLGNIN